MTTVFGSEARERGSAVRLGRKIMPATRTMRTKSMGKRPLRIFSLLLAGFTNKLWQICGQMTRGI